MVECIRAEHQRVLRGRVVKNRIAWILIAGLFVLNVFQFAVCRSKISALLEQHTWECATLEHHIGVLNDKINELSRQTRRLTALR